MPVPSAISDLSTTPASNSPAGSETPSSTDDYLRTQAAFIKQLATSSHIWCGTATGTANALALTPSAAITAYVAGLTFRFKASLSNLGATTIAVSGLAAIDLEISGVACVGGEILAGKWYEITLSSATKAQLSNIGSLSANLTTAFNEKRSTVALTATTSPIWTAGTGKIIDGTGTPTITDFPAAPQAGSQREIYPTAGTALTNGGNISVQGNASVTAAAGDKWIINAITTTTFYVEIIRKDGFPLISATQAQCRLAKSGANLLLSPYQGNRLTINGLPQAIPSAGVSLAPTSLPVPSAGASYSITSNVVTYVTGTAHGVVAGGKFSIKGSALSALNGSWTAITAPTATSITFALTNSNVASTPDTTATVIPLVFIYAYMSGSTMTLEGSNIAHATDSTNGVEIKSGDATRTLVGMTTMGAGPVFVDTDSQRFVRSWFNDSGVAGGSSLLASVANATSGYIEIFGSSRSEFLAWANESALPLGSGHVISSAAGNVYCGVAIDSASPSANDTGIAASSVASGGLGNITCGAPSKTFSSDGYHFVTMYGKNAAATMTWQGNAESAERCAISFTTKR